jgi:VanZ family protein
MNKGKNLLKYLMIFWLGLIWLLSSLPAYTLPKLDTFNLDKIAHVTVYFILGYLILLNYRYGLFKHISYQSVMLTAIILAALDESHQIFITNRSVSLLDLSANMTGLIIAYFVSKRRIKAQ